MEMKNCDCYPCGSTGLVLKIWIFKGVHDPQEHRFGTKIWIPQLSASVIHYQVKHRVQKLGTPNRHYSGLNTKIEMMQASLPAHLRICNTSSSLWLCMLEYLFDFVDSCWAIPDEVSCSHDDPNPTTAYTNHFIINWQLRRHS